MWTMRSHNSGSLFQRKSGKQKGAWVALVTMRNGKRVSRWAKDRDTAKAELAELLRLRDAGAPSHPLHETNVVKYLARDLAEAGLPRVTNHSLRHSAASLLIKEGMPMPVVSAILGHSTIRITMDIYAHVMEDSKREASDAMQRALG